MRKEFCRVGMRVRVGFVLRRARNGMPYLDLSEHTGLEGTVLLADPDDGLVIIEDDRGERYGLVAEELHQVLTRRAS
jgi:hypothetical protein